MNNIKSGQRLKTFFHSPVYGIEYNQISHNKRVSNRIYKIDVASNPRIVKGISLRGRFGYLFIDVQKDAHLVNDKNSSINYHEDLIKGS